MQVGDEPNVRGAHRLAGERIDAIYVTSLRRTGQTAAPLAAKLGLTPHVERQLREVGLGESFTLIVATVLGGAGTLLGPMLGGAFFTYLPAISQGFQQWTTVLEGALVIVVLSLAPSGVLGSSLNAIARLRRIALSRIEARRQKKGDVRVRVPA